MVFLRRSRAGPDPHLQFKIFIFAVSAGLALTGIAFDIGWLVNVAIGLLVVTLIGARIARARRRSSGE